MRPEVLRVLVANEPRTNREVLTAALRKLRPHIEVIAAEPHELDGSVLRLRPHLVVCSRLTEAVRDHAPSWILLYPGGDSLVVLHIAGEHETAPDLDLDGFLAVIDRTEALLQRG